MFAAQCDDGKKTDQWQAANQSGLATGPAPAPATLSAARVR